MSDITQSDVVVDSSPQVEEVIDNPIVEEVETEGEQPKVEADKQEDEDDDSSLPKGEIKRIAKLTRQKYEQQAVINKLQSRLDAIEAQTVSTLQEPDISQFEDLDSYVKAQVKYEKELEKQQTQSQQAQQNQAQAVAQDWVAKVDKVRSVAPDFDTVFNNVASIEFAPMALEAVAQHPKGAEIAYMLGKDVSEAYRIAALPPSQQLMAIGELAAKTNLPKPKTVSSAPPPVKTVSGGNVTTDPSKMSTSDYIKWRNDQQRQKKR
jgi:hypothetical protein